jgi:hypothetical protein
MAALSLTSSGMHRRGDRAPEARHDSFNSTTVTGDFIGIPSDIRPGI